MAAPAPPPSRGNGRKPFARALANRQRRRCPVDLDRSGRTQPNKGFTVGSRRTLILIAAIAVGAIASFLIWNYVGGIEERAEGDAQRVKVFVVKSQIVRGTYGEESRDQDLIVEDDAPQKFVPANAIRSLDDITGQVAINDLAPNQIVTSDMFAAPEVAQSTFAERL